MKKYIGVAALILLLLQFSGVTYEFTRTNADTIVLAAEKKLIIGSNFAQKSGSTFIPSQVLLQNGIALFDRETALNGSGIKIVKLASDSKSALDDKKLSKANYHHDFLLDNFWSRYRSHIIFGSIIIAIGLLYVIFNQRARKKQFVLLKASEAMLRNVTNNICGGVLVLNPQKEFQISYVNDGFLKLIGYTKEELYGIETKEYSLFIHNGDRIELEKLIMPDDPLVERSNDFSIQLRIKAKDGLYVPVLVKGSLVRNGQGGKELFCVVLDISRERAMLEELEFEQERHRILLEKSDEILFEINYAEQTVKVSPKFKEKFGWSLPRMYWGDEEPDMVQVYEEDRQNFAKTLNEIAGGKNDGEFMARVCKLDGTPCWCKILYHAMRTDDEKVQLIGKITDIDAEMKEKEFLMQKAQMDALTGLYNKDAFRSRCVEYLSKYQDINNAVVFFDVDNFKEINDSLGHAVGDKALLDVSKKMQGVFSNSDILGRFGGDEFCVLVKDVTKQELIKTLQELLKELRLEYSDGIQTTSVSVSIGAVCSTEFGNDFDKLLEFADKAQYFAKERGKDAFALYSNQIRLSGYEGRKIADH